MATPIIPSYMRGCDPENHSPRPAHISIEKKLGVMVITCELSDSGMQKIGRSWSLDQKQDKTVSSK
jgi:hypothetical protein